MEERYRLLGELMPKMKDGQKITFTPSNIAKGDDFLIFSGCDSCTVTIHKSSVPYWLEFDNDEPMRLEDVPTSFLRSLLKNI